MTKKDKSAKKRKNEKKGLERQKAKAKYVSEIKQIQSFRQKAPHLKQILKKRGCNLHFYDFLDSYTEVFASIVKDATANFSTLLGVHEIDSSDKKEKFWESLGYENLTQIFYTIDDEFVDYGKSSEKKQATLNGEMTSFRDADNTLRSIITIKRNIKVSVQANELKYAFKIASLLHEIGHVKDLESGINFDVTNNKMDVIEAEVFANLYALEELANRHLFYSFGILLDAIRNSIPQGGYIGKVAKRVLERLPEYQLIDWQSFINDEGLTQEENRLIGHYGRRELSS